ncbi:MAG: sugar phosphate isomerase/epimerase [Kiritimatiellaeota bacterium]|nr:sugar phosphate isomerase/epimerase [Kiritimatiellota bacterium]
MKFGICSGIEKKNAELAREAGFGYLEGGVAAVLRPAESEAAFEDGWALMRECGLPVEALNCFLPGNLKVTGQDVNQAPVVEYAVTAIRRAGKAGIPIIVFGSGGARAVPEGFCHACATKQLEAFVREIAPVAVESKVLLVMEPLSRTECNMLSSVKEAAGLVRRVNHPGVRLLVDGYHVAANGEPLSDVAEAGELFRHVHCATFPARKAPGREPYDFGPFLSTLRAAGYDHRVSIEGDIDWSPTALRTAFTTLTES